MTSSVRYWIQQIAFLLIFAGCYFLVWEWIVKLEPVVEHKSLQIKYHGADLMTEKWNGEIRAYQWKNGKYKLMWIRKAKINQ